MAWALSCTSKHARISVITIMFTVIIIIIIIVVVIFTAATHQIAPVWTASLLGRISDLVPNAACRSHWVSTPTDPRSRSTHHCHC